MTCTSSEDPVWEFKCDGAADGVYCGASFRDRKLMVKHVRWYHGKPSLKCTVCGWSTKYPGNLKRHMTKVHKDV